MHSADVTFMQYALEEAQQAAHCGEVPVGALLVKEGKVIARGHNQPISTCDPTAHAEVVVLRQAAMELGNYRLLSTTLYVTLEPCVMCIGALIHARVARVVYGALDPKAGAVTSVFELGQDLRFNHRIVYESGILAEECSRLLTAFFKAKR